MENLITILAAAVALVVGGVVGRALEVRKAKVARRTAEDESTVILEAARTEADNLRRAAELQGKEEGYRLKQELLEEAEQRRVELEKTEKGSAEYDAVRARCKNACIHTTFEFHHWLIDHGYEIVRPE